jgi:hypothetical protein
MLFRLISWKLSSMKNVTLLFLLGFSLFANSQTIPNAGFEDWTECPTAAEPIPFQTSNAISYLISGSLSVERSTNAHGGNYAAYAHADASQEIQGFFSLGQDFNTGEITPLPFSGTPDSISFWAQHTISDLDFGTVVFTLYQDMTEVGYGIATFNENTSGYTYYSSPVNIEAGATPNGMTLGIYSGDDASLNGQLYIDDIHLIYNTGSGDDIPGGDFENWNVTNAQCLDNWTTTNGYTFPNLSVTQGEPYSGNHSVRITNQPTFFDGNSLGYILLGDPESDFCSAPSLELTDGQAPSSINGFYKFTAGNPNEMATLFLYCSAANDLGGCDSLFELYQYMPAAAEWTAFNINIPANVIQQWETGVAPDYVTIGFVSTMVSNEAEPNGDPNSVLWIDDVSLNYTTIQVAESMSLLWTIFPNPASDLLQIQSKSSTARAIDLLDSFGRIVASIQTSGERTSIDTSQLSNGVYTLRITDVSNVTSQQVVIQH